VKKANPKSSPILVWTFFPLSLGVAKRASRNPTAAKDVTRDVRKVPDKMLVWRWKQAPAAAARVDMMRHVYTCFRCF